MLFRWCLLGRVGNERWRVRTRALQPSQDLLLKLSFNNRMLSHFVGTALVIEQVEKYWCPSFTSSDLTGGKPFRFQGAE